MKSVALQHPERIELTPRGVAEDRRFFVTDGEGRLVGGVKYGTLAQVQASWDGETLGLTFPDGRAVADSPAVGPAVETDFYGKRTVLGNVVVGPWADALSDYVSASLRLVRVADASHATDIEVATLVSDGSLAAIGGLDGRRFRMLLELEGCAAFEEDGWDGALVRVGEAVLRVAGPVPRCAVTTQDPDTGLRDHDTLRAIKDVRGQDEHGKLNFGMYGEVVQPGAIVVGDEVSRL